MRCKKPREAPPIHLRNPNSNSIEFDGIRKPRIHTDAIKDTLIPHLITKSQASAVYASEADLLNVALFGQTAKQWREANPAASFLITDH